MTATTNQVVLQNEMSVRQMERRVFTTLGTPHTEWCVWCNKLTERVEKVGLCTDIIECAECGKMQEFYDKTDDYEEGD